MRGEKRKEGMFLKKESKSEDNVEEKEKIGVKARVKVKKEVEVLEEKDF